MSPNSVLPLLRWAGSKKRQFAAFRRYFPDRFANYIEPFAGSASFMFGLQPSIAYINDINRDVVDLYNNVLRDSDFYKQFLSIRRDRDTYYNVRSAFNKMDRSPKKSILFYYLNRNCFNGIYRVNKKGDFNVPFSELRVSPYLSVDQFASSLEIIKRATIKRMDFEKFAVTYAKAGDFVYLDPPYYMDSVRVHNEYNIVPFGPSDFERLAGLLATLDQRGCLFMLTFPDSKEVRHLAERWSIRKTTVFRSVAGNPASRRRQAECLVCNYV